MLKYPAGLEVKILISIFIYIHTLRKQAAKALVSLRFCAGSPEILLLDNAISTKISFAGSYNQPSLQRHSLSPNDLTN